MCMSSTAFIIVGYRRARGWMSCDAFSCSAGNRDVQKCLGDRISPPRRYFSHTTTIDADVGGCPRRVRQPCAVDVGLIAN